MVRTIITPDKQTISLEIPADYVGQEVEVIAFTKDEGMKRKDPSQRDASFNAIALDTISYKFNRDEANER